MAVLLAVLIAVGAAGLASVALWFAHRNNRLLSQVTAQLDGLDTKVDDVRTLQGAIGRLRTESSARHLRGLRTAVPVAAAAAAAVAGAVMTDNTLIHGRRDIPEAAATPAEPRPIESHSPPEPYPPSGPGGHAAARSVEPPDDAPVAVPPPPAAATVPPVPTTTPPSTTTTTTTLPPAPLAATVTDEDACVGAAVTPLGVQLQVCPDLVPGLLRPEPPEQPAAAQGSAA